MSTEQQVRQAKVGNLVDQPSQRRRKCVEVVVNLEHELNLRPGNRRAEKLHQPLVLG